MSKVIKPQTRDIGFPVRRILPSAQQWMVGPFIFLDHMGPALFPQGTTEGDVRPHPHIGLATVTYLFSGAFMHRDSMGVVQRIDPGAVNVMVAGRGVVHSERIPDDIRDRQQAVEGIQMWMALPMESEEAEPAFTHYPAAALPVDRFEGGELHLLIGALGARHSPVDTGTETLFAVLTLAPGASWRMPAGAGDRALYLASGSLAVDSEPLPQHHLMVVDATRDLLLTSSEGARVVIVGGQPYPETRHIVWNFVSTRAERIEQAKADWQAQRFATVPGETEFIPLPA